MRFCLSLLLAATLPALATAADAPPITPQLGAWDFTSRLSAEQLALLQGLDSVTLKALEQHDISYDLKAGTMTVKACLNKQNLAGWSSGDKLLARDAECDPPSYAAQGDTMTVDYQCRLPSPSHLHSVFKFSPKRDSYTFEHQLQSEDQNSKTSGQARRTGDC